jgi:taurine dioxygenase
MVTVNRFDAPLGAQISGVDVGAIDSRTREEILQALYRHQVLVLRLGDPIPDDVYVRFGRIFGELENPRIQSPLASRPEIMVVSNIRKNGQPQGRLPDGEMSFHFDMVHQKMPNKAGILHAVEVPTVGGDTLFANMYLAYETLPADMKKRLSGLTALNTYSYGSVKVGAKNLDADSPAAVHPVIRTIPETGKKALYVSRLMTDHIIGMPEDESQALLESLCGHYESEDFIYRHQWKPGDVLIWDNRCTAHARTDFSPEERRLLKRLTVIDTIAPH